jgi:hypothetical protein
MSLPGFYMVITFLPPKTGKYDSWMQVLNKLLRFRNVPRWRCPRHLQCVRCVFQAISTVSLKHVVVIFLPVPFVFNHLDFLNSRVEFENILCNIHQQTHINVITRRINTASISYCQFIMRTASQNSADIYGCAQWTSPPNFYIHFSSPLSELNVQPNRISSV